MRYDNPIVQSHIDRIVMEILAKPDEEFLDYVNNEDRWEWDIAQNLYAYLRLSPPNCFKGLGPVIRYFRDNFKGMVSFQKKTSLCYNLQIWQTCWSFERNLSDTRRPFGFSLKMRTRDYMIAEDDCIPAGVILAISYHYPYIQEKANELILETEKRRMINSIKKSATV